MEKSLSPKHIKKAEIWWWKFSQSESFSQEIHTLHQRGELPRSSRLYKLNVYLDDDKILRVKGRLDVAVGISEETKHPVVLDS